MPSARPTQRHLAPSRSALLDRAPARRLVRLLAAIALLGVTLTGNAGGEGWAHELSNGRQIVLQVGPEKAELLVIFEVPGGTNADLERVLHDSDADGALNEAERKTLAARLSRDALAGLQLTRDGVGLEATGLDWRLAPRSQGSNAILLVLLVQLDGGPGRYEVSLATEDADADASLEVEAGEGLVLSDAVSAPDAEGIAVGPLVLSAGPPLWFVVSKPASLE